MNEGHIRSGEVINLKTLKDGMSKQATFALTKTDDMEVIRMVLPRGKSIREHSVEGEMSVLCLKGEVLFRIGEEAHTLTEDDWLFLHRNAPHSLHAKEDTVLLLTILFISDNQ